MINIDYILQNHGYGGGSGTGKDKTPPPPCTNFTATAGNAQVVLNWTNPVDSDFVGIKILRKEGSYPTSPTDGTLVYSGANTSYTDTTVINGTQYCYHAYTFDYDNNFNINDSGQEATATPTAVREYGINWNKSMDVITRLGDAIGLIANPGVGAINDFSNLYPWNGMKRCNLSDTGVVNAYYGDVTYKTDGSNGQCMVEIPKFYYKVVNVDANNIQFWITDNPKSGYEVHPAFFRCRDKPCDDQTGVAIEVDKRYHHTYLPFYNLTSWKLESKSGVFPTVSKSLDNGRAYAKARGNGWSLADFNLKYAIQLLYLIEYAHFNSQDKVGRGYINGSSPCVTGGTNSYGNNSYGSNTVDNIQVNYRGIEDLWGNCFQRIDGYYVPVDGYPLIGNKGFNNAGIGYVASTICIQSSGGFISDITGDKVLGFVPNGYVGSNSTKLYDYGISTRYRFPIVGGGYEGGFSAGIFAFNCNNDNVATSTNTALSLAY